MLVLNCVSSCWTCVHFYPFTNVVFAFSFVLWI